MKITNDHQKERDYLEVFQKVTRLVSGVHDPQQIMDLIVQRLPVLLEVDAATIRLLDPAKEKFILGAAWGVSDEYLSRSTIDSEEVMQALMEGKPTARTDMDITCDHDSCAFISREGVKSAMSLPILFKDQLVGLLRLLTKDNRKFSDDEIRFAMSLAEQVGVAIVNSRMFQELENQVEFYQVQREISTLVHSSLDLDHVLETIVEKLPRIMEMKGCTIRLLQPATNRLDLVAASGLSQKYLNRGSISREDSIFKVLGGEPVAIYDAPNDPRVDYHDEIREEGIKSILAIPIRNENEIIGVLRLLSDTHRSFTASEIHLAVTVAEEGGNAIEKARTYRKITLLFNQIEEHERFLQAILDSLFIQIIVLDSSKCVVMANRQFLEAHGLREEDILGKPYELIASARCENDWSDLLDKVLQTTQSTMIKQVCSKDGDKQWLEHHYTPIIGPDTTVDFVIVGTRDITDQVLLESEKLQRTKLEGVVEMAGTAAHELNTPLFAALGTAQLLRDDLPTAEMQEEMDIIIRNISTMKELTRKMTKVTGFETTEYVGDTNIIALKSAKNQSS